MNIRATINMQKCLLISLALALPVLGVFANSEQPNLPKPDSQIAPQEQQGAIPNLPSISTPTQVSATDPSDSFGTIFDPAFQGFIKEQFPLTPQQIKALHEVYLNVQRAVAAPVETPTPTLSTKNVPLAPGSVPPVVKMATGYVSSVVFMDETGQPWPIANLSLGNPEAFNIQWDTSSNVLMIQGTKPYESGNIAIRLAGLSTPVMLTMTNDQHNVDYRVDLRIQGRGPNAKAALLGSAIPEKTSPVLMDLLDGVAPLGSTKLSVQGGPAQAWQLGKNLYLRTQMTMLSPSWTATLSSSDGTRVYELLTTPLILASLNGQTTQLKIEGL